MSRIRKFLKGCGEGAAIAAVAVGITAWSVYGLKGVNDAHDKGERQKIERLEKSRFLRKKTLGVLVDYSIEPDPLFDLMKSLDKAIKKNNDAFATDYDVEFRYINLKNPKIKGANVYSVIPKGWKKDYYLFVTNGSLVGQVMVNKKRKDYSNYAGWCFNGVQKLMIIHKFKTYHSEEWMPNLISHEMGHCQGYSGHHTNQKCIMFPTVFPDQEFCDDSIEIIRRKNGLL